MIRADRSETTDPKKAPGEGLLRWAPAALILAGLLVVLLTGGWRHLSLEELRDRRSLLKAFVSAHPLESLALYVGIYVLVVALSIPGALIMTLTGGFLFGPLLGGAAAVAGVSAGSVVMFLLARSALGALLRKLAPRGGPFARVEEALRRHAFTAILSLRLLPAAPIWLVNLLAGAAGMPLGLYAAATVIGVAPSSFVYATLGSGLDAVFARPGPLRIGSLFGPEVLAPLCGLGLAAAVSAGIGVVLRRDG